MPRKVQETPKGGELLEPVGLSIGITGVNLHLAIHKIVDITVDATIVIFPENCGLGVIPPSFSVEADLPLFAQAIGAVFGGLDPVFARVIEEITEVVLGPELKQNLIDLVKKKLNGDPVKGTPGVIPPDKCSCLVFF